jgi:carboxypeptidase family protein
VSGALTVLCFCLIARSLFAQTVAGVVHHETGGVLPGVSVELRPASGAPLAAVTDAAGAFRFDRVAAGHYTATIKLINFATARREVDVAASGSVRLDVALHLSLNADVTVTGKRTFANLGLVVGF